VPSVISDSAGPLEVVEAAGDGVGGDPQPTMKMRQTGGSAAREHGSMEVSIAVASHRLATPQSAGGNPGKLNARSAYVIRKTVPGTFSVFSAVGTKFF
jgi:hypothetical protein